MAAARQRRPPPPPPTLSPLPLALLYGSGGGPRGREGAGGGGASRLQRCVAARRRPRERVREARGAGGPDRVVAQEEREERAVPRESLRQHPHPLRRPTCSVPGTSERPPPPLLPPFVLIGHAASFTPY